MQGENVCDAPKTKLRTLSHPFHKRICARAHEIWLELQEVDQSPESDWLQAEAAWRQAEEEILHEPKNSSSRRYSGGAAS